MTAPDDIMDVQVGPEDPAEDVPVETLRAGLASDDQAVRLHAANVASFVPHDESQRLVAVLPELLELLSAEKRVTIYQSTIALAIVSENDPEELEEAIPRLVELLDNEMSLIRSTVAHCLANVAMERPELVVPQIETLVAVATERPPEAVDRAAIENEALDDDQRESLQVLNWEESKRTQMAREVAANLLVEVAAEDGASLEPFVEDLAAALDDAPITVQLALADVFAEVAKDDPAAATPAVPALQDLLAHDTVSLAATAVTALGFIGDEAAVEPLRELADDEDRDEDLRDLAGETADFIAGEAQ